MKKLTENEFEEIFNEIKDLRCLNFSKINGFDKLDEEDQIRIIHEWTIYGSEDSKINLADEIIKQNDNEPYTDVRIAKKLNITISLAKIIKDYVLAIEDGEINVPTNREKCIRFLRNKIEPFINDKNIEIKRRQLLKEELDGMCEKGDPERMHLAYIIARTFRVTKNYYEARGNITSSLVAYYLGIHNIDCFKYKLDYHMCHGKNFKNPYSLVFRVSQDKQTELKRMIEEKLKDNENLVFGKVCSEVNKSGNQFVLSNRMFVSKTKEILNKCKLFTDRNNTCYKCITKSDADKFGLDQIQIRIEGRWFITFLKNMNALHPFKEKCINLENTQYLNYLLKSNAKTPLFLYHYDYLKSKFDTKENLSFNEFVECISYHFDSIEDSGPDYVFSKVYRGDVISTCYNLLKICYYLANFTDEAVREYSETYFVNSKIRNNIITNASTNESNNFSIFLKEYHSKFQKRFIGIFFIIDGKLKVYKEELNIAESNDFMDVNMGHFELFNSYNLPKEFEYSMYPRGRVLYNVRNRLFYVYADKIILKDKEKLELIKKEFALPKYNVVYKSDEHYKTLKY